MRSQFFMIDKGVHPETHIQAEAQAHPERRGAHRFFRSLALLTTWSILLGADARAQSSQAAAFAADLAAIRKNVGAFEAAFRLSNKVVLIERDPSTVYETHATMKTLVDDKRHNTVTKSETVYFKDETAPAELITRNLQNVFDGTRHLEIDFDNKDARIDQDDDFPHLNPKNLWLDFQGKRIEDRLLEPTVEELGVTNVNGLPSVGFQVANDPVAYGEGAKTRIWVSQSDEGPCPIRMESGNLQPSGDFVVRHEVDVLKVGRTKNGMPFPLAARQRLYAKSGESLICYTERSFDTVEFEDQVPVDDSSFKIQIPDQSIFINDHIAGVGYWSNEVNGSTLSELDSLLKSADSVVAPEVPQHAAAVQTDEPSAGNVSREVEINPESQLLLRVTIIAAVLSGLTAIIGFVGNRRKVKQ